MSPGAAVKADATVGPWRVSAGARGKARRGSRSGWLRTLSCSQTPNATGRFEVGVPLRRERAWHPAVIHDGSMLPATPNRPIETRSSAFPFPTLSREDVTTRLLNGTGDETDNEGEDSSKGNLNSSPAEESAWTGLSPLDETLEKIGMGYYQKSLL